MGVVYSVIAINFVYEHCLDLTIIIEIEHKLLLKQILLSVIAHPVNLVEMIKWIVSNYSFNSGKLLNVLF